VENSENLDFTREDFPSLQQMRGGCPPIYFDNACTTLVPRPVIDSLMDYYSRYPACGGGRSRHWFAREVTARIEGNPAGSIAGSRRVIQDFLHACSTQEIIFTLNASHAINLVALGLKFQPGDTVLLTDKEHNSNLVPWLRLQNQGLIRVAYVGFDAQDNLDLATYHRQLQQNRVRLVSMAYTSNLTGSTLPVKEVVQAAHRQGVPVLLDAAQTVPHQTIDVQDLAVDFLAFSLHKMCGPKGVGVLYGRQERLMDTLEPVCLGGETVSDTSYDSYALLEPPARFEVGIQNYAGQIAAGAAVRYLQNIGFDRIRAQEARLNRFLTYTLLDRYGDTGWFRILGPADAGRRGGILTFEIKRPNAFGIADELNERSNIMLRDGAFCVNSYLNREFGPAWTKPGLPGEHRMAYRVSLYFYNTLAECQVFLTTLHDILTERGYL
jgi:cysteine desulfurase / selenocysteine lyase